MNAMNYTTVDNGEECLAYFLLSESRNEQPDKRYRVMLAAAELLLEEPMKREILRLASHMLDVEQLVAHEAASQRAEYRKEIGQSSGLAFLFERVERLPLPQRIEILGLSTALKRCAGTAESVCRWGKVSKRVSKKSVWERGVGS